MQIIKEKWEVIPTQKALELSFFWSELNRHLIFKKELYIAKNRPPATCQPTKQSQSNKITKKYKLITSLTWGNLHSALPCHHKKNTLDGVIFFRLFRKICGKTTSRVARVNGTVKAKPFGYSTSFRSLDSAVSPCWIDSCRWRKDASFLPPAQGHVILSGVKIPAHIW